MKLPEEFTQAHYEFLKAIVHAHEQGIVGPYKPTPEAKEYLKLWEDKQEKGEVTND